MNTCIMEQDDILREQLLEAVEQQIKSNDPPETRQTYERLINEGYDDDQIRQMISACMLVETYEVVRSKRPYDNQRYINMLKNLPAEPFTD